MVRKLLPALAASALLLAACSGSAPGEVVAQASEKTQSQETSRVSFEGTIEVSGGDPVTFTGEGTADYESQGAQMTFDMSEVFSQTGAQLPGTQDMEVIVDGSVVYMKAEFFKQLAPGIKEWLKIDYRKAAEAQGIDLSQLNQLGRNDPLLELSLLKGAGKVEEAGTEEVRGVSTTHYEMTVDLEEVSKTAPEELRPQFDQLIEASGSKTLPVDVWIDDEGLVRRVGYEFELQNTPSGEPSETTTTLELYDFGIDAGIQPPPESETTDFLELLRQQGAIGE